MKATIKETVPAKDVIVTYADGILSIKGPKGTIQRKFNDPRIKVSHADGKINLVAELATRREKMLMGTYVSHMYNMVTGVTEGFIYELKICSGHFPMTVAVQGDELVVKNFIGEKKPRKLKLKTGAKVTVDGTIIKIEAIDKEIAGMTASAIELLTRRPGFDNRIFQDGIYITSKAGKVL